jgi:hypothetical protein
MCSRLQESAFSDKKRIRLSSAWRRIAMKSEHARLAMRVALIGAAIAVVLAVAQRGVRADQIPTGWQASNMKPVG